MFIKDFYKNLTKEEIIEGMEMEGFEPHEFVNPAGFKYDEHSHPESKLIGVVEGSIDIDIEGEKFHLEAGDRILIEPNKKHSAVVGENGCTFLWAEDLLDS